MVYRCLIIRFSMSIGSNWPAAAVFFSASSPPIRNSIATTHAGSSKLPERREFTKLSPETITRLITRVTQWLCITICFGLMACQQKIADQRSARPLVEGTVARSDLQSDEYFYTGKINGSLVDRFPFLITEQSLRRGQERYDIFCSPCHDRVGTGLGMIVRRGYRPPPSFHIDRLRSAPVGYFFDVMTHGFGTMPDYAEQVPPADRWAIVAYIRALQLSQCAKVGDLPEKERRALAKSKQ